MKQVSSLISVAKFYFLNKLNQLVFIKPMKTYVLKAMFVFVFFTFLIHDSYGQTNIWDGSGGNNWSTASSWSLNVVPAATHDVLINIGGTFTISDVPTTSILKLRITGNTNVTLVCNTSASQTITVNSATADAIDVDAGSILQLQGIRSGGPANQYSLTLTTSNTVGLEANIDGTLIVKRDGTNLNANGIFTKGGTNATINFNSGSIYTHAVDGSLIPAAIWNLLSTCNITGITSTAPAGLTQTFGNFTWNCPGHSTLINLNSQLQTINGNFTVLNGGQATGRTTSNGLALSANTDFTLNIGGNFSIDHTGSNATWLMMTNGTANVTINVGGNFNISKTSVLNNTYTYFDYKAGTGTAMGTLVMIVAGNLTMTGGYLDMGYQASSYTAGTELRLNGNLSVSATSTIITSGTSIVNGKIIFNKAGIQTMFEGAAGVTAYVNYQVNSGSTTELLSNFYLYDYANALKSGNFTIQGGAVLDMNTYILHGYYVAGGSINTVNTYTSFTLSSSAGIITAKAEGVHRIGFINGSVSAAIATRTFNSSANYTYDGSVIQNSGTFVTSPIANQVNNLTISNTSGNTTGVTLEQPIAVAGTCTFNTGLLTTTTTNLLTINDNATATGAKNTPVYSFANGPVKKTGNDAFGFPVGKLVGGYRILSISAPANTTDEFICEFKRADATLLGPVTAPGLVRVSSCEYWLLDKASGANASIDVTLSWNELSPCNVLYVSDPYKLTVAHFNGTSWDTHGFAPPPTGNATAGTVTRSAVSVFSPFSLGSISLLENILPVELVDLQLQKHKEGILVKWKNIKEDDIAYYQVLRSTNGKDFILVGTIKPLQNSGTETHYQFVDKSATAAAYYYRIKLVNNKNEGFYSNTARMNLESKSGSVYILSNPVIYHRVGLQMNDLPAGIYNITLLNSSGQVVFKNNLNHVSGSSTYTVQLSSAITKGVYYLQVNGADSRFTRSILIN